jgi:hypothetical protein
LKKPNTKKGLVEWLKGLALRLNHRTAKNKQKDGKSWAGGVA